MMAKLVLNPNSSSKKEIALHRGLVSIGRDPTNDLVLPDAMVSRRHAVIEFRSSQYFIRDCNSSNGSLVNGDRVSERNLRDGDLVAIGTARILFRDDIPEGGGKVVPHPSAPRQQCPTCGADYRKGDAFCRNCGVVLAPLPQKVVCTACGTVVPLPAKFCNACGGELGPIAGENGPPSQSLEVGRAVEALPPPIASPETPAPAPEIREAPRITLPRAPTPLLAKAARAPEAGTRFVAALIDFGIVLAVEALLLAVPGYYWITRKIPTGPEQVQFFPILFSVGWLTLCTVVGTGYFVYFWGVKGATPGKTAAGLEVEGSDGTQPIGIPRAFARLFGYVVSSVLLGAGFLLILFGKEALHDRIAGTRVVLKKKG